MALTTQEQTAVRAILAREGGFDAVCDQIRALHIADRRAAAVTALGTAVSVTVSDWQIPAQYVAQAGNETLPSVIADITTAWGARNQAALGALFVQLYGAAKRHLNL
jgi:hypothetical protein